MLEEMFDELKEPQALQGAMRVLRFYHLLRWSGLRIRHGRYAGCNFKYGRNGGVATIDIRNPLYLSFSVYMGENEHVEFSVASRETDDDVTLFHIGTSWALCYTRDDRHPDVALERLAALFGVEGDAEPTRIDHLHVRSFLREVSLLTVPVTDRILPATL